MRSNEFRAMNYHKIMVLVKVEGLICSIRLEFELLESSSRYGYLCSKSPRGKVHENFHVLGGSFLEKELLVEALYEFDVGNLKL